MEISGASAFVGLRYWDVLWYGRRPVGTSLADALAAIVHRLPGLVHAQEFHYLPVHQFVFILLRITGVPVHCHRSAEPDSGTAYDKAGLQVGKMLKRIDPLSFMTGKLHDSGREVRGFLAGIITGNRQAEPDHGTGHEHLLLKGYLQII